MAVHAHSSELRKFGSTLADEWAFPMDLMFLQANGSFTSKLNSLDDFNASKLSNADLLFAHIDRNFGPAPLAAR